jgi:hypothetical protein
MSELISGRRRAALSRRQTLAAAATVGVGLVAGSGISIAAAHETGKKAPEHKAAEADAIVVRVRDLNAGTLDIFTATERIQVRDKELAKRLANAAKKR